MEKINLIEILKDCPKGMDLYSPLCGDCKLYDITDYTIRIETPNKDTLISLYHDGRYCSGGEIMIFPKGKTTWEGFVSPCQLKEGDVVTYEYENGLVSMILNKFVNFVEVHYYCALYNNAKGFVTNNYIVGEPKYTHLATEEEKQKLFQAIKDNGYKWNAETKTLEKLVEPKFDPATLKPFDRVLVRDTLKDRWHIDFFEKIDKVRPKYDTVCTAYCHCIPYNDETKHLLGKAEMEPEFYQVDEYE